MNESPNPHQDKVYQAPKIVANKVYSSAQVVAMDSDLVLLGVVKSDAEVMSYGSVSAYKEVQGKVFAGISGDEKATIFIHSFNAQLVSIAGVYKRFDVVPTKLYARSVMIDLNKGKLRFQIVWVTQDFLLELGTEELPPKLLKQLSNALTNNVITQLSELNLSYTKVASFATPRRLAVLVNEPTMSAKRPNLLNAKALQSVHLTKQLKVSPNHVALLDLI